MSKLIAKIIMPICIITASISLCSCNKKAFTGKVNLSYGDVPETPYQNWKTDLNIITYSKLTGIIADKESFAIAIYGSETCDCWTTFVSNCLFPYLNEYNARVYVISLTELDNKDAFGLNVSNSQPTFALFNKGSLVYQAVYGKTSTNMFQSKKDFYSFMETYSNLPKLYFVNKNVLQKFMDDDKEFFLYSSLTGCPDCNQVNSDFVYDWLETNTIKNKIYVFKTDSYWGSSQTKKEITDFLKLNEDINPQTGWLVGKVPSYQVWKGDELEDMITVYNDSRNSETGVVTSYFTQDRLQYLKFLKNDTTITDKVLDGKIVSEKEWHTEGSLYKSDAYAKKYHMPIVKLFFETYLK